MFVAALFTIVSTIIAAIFTWVVYNLYFHPLAKYPGPWAWRAFRFSMLKAMLAGRLPHRIRELHKQYGPIVRVAPDELSFCEPLAWQEIYSRREFHRPVQWRGKPPGETADSLIQAAAPVHARLRKAFSPAFSEKAVRGYADSITAHIDLLINKLHSKPSTTPVDLVKWMNFCLFDVTMDIGWGANFSLLEKEDYHPWVTVTQGFKALIVGCCLKYYEPLASFAQNHMPQEARDSLNMVLGIARKNVQNRLKLQTERRDIFANTLGRNQSLADAGLTEDEMVANSMNYVIAGSESVTTVLAGALHQLLQSPSTLHTLSSAVRSAFAQPHDITGPACQQRVPYLDAVLKEALRLCPTVPDGMRREVPDDNGAVICGQHVPKGTVVSVPTWTIFTSPRFWSDAADFAPERWLAEPAAAGGRCAKDFPNDDRNAYHPFAYGPRNCIGVNLGWEEMRVLLARLVWEFDMALPTASNLPPWEAQNIFWVWEKVPLEVVLVPVRASSG